MITYSEAAKLLKGNLIEIGKKADEIRRKKHGINSYYVLNRQINYSNICISRCKFCAFARSPGEKGEYLLSNQEIIDIIGQRETDEVHIVGGLHPDLLFYHYTDMIKAIRSNFPDIWIKAFTAAEIEHFSTISGLQIEKVLSGLKTAGLNSLTGGGAEIFSDRIRQRLFPKKAGAEKWLFIHKSAHKIGLRSSATMLFGHIETDDEIVHHLFELRKLQAETNGFNAFVALPFHSGSSFLDLPPVSAVRILKVIALSRIILSNFPHIKTYWVMLTPRLAEIAQFFGADDLDGTIGKELITHSAGTESPSSMSEEKLRQLITGAGFVPVRRTGNYLKAAL